MTENNIDELIFIKGYEYIYKINPKNGDIWSCYKKRFMNPSISSKGYKIVVLADKENKRKTKMVGRLVYLSFHNKTDDDIKDKFTY